MIKLLLLKLPSFSRYILMVLYHFFMTLLTLDSFLNFHVTKKYSIHCITKKLLKILSTSLTFAVIIALILIGLLQCKVIIHSWKVRFYGAICDDYLRYFPYYPSSCDLRIYFCGLWMTDKTVEQFIQWEDKKWSIQLYCTDFSYNNSCFTYSVLLFLFHDDYAWITFKVF